VRSSRNAPAKQVDPDAARKKKLAIVGVLGVLVLAGAGLVVLKMKQDAANRVVIAERQRQLELEREHGAVLQEAKKLIREYKWVEAKEILVGLQQKAPGIVEVKDYLERADKEIPNMEHLAAAEAALKERKLAATKGSLDQVSEDTQAYEWVKKLRNEMSEAANLQAREARKLLDGKQLDPAKAITDDVLAAFADHRDAKIINDEAVRLIKIRDTPVQPAPPPPPKDPWETAVARFVDGDISGAVALANACVTKSNKCKGGLKDMTEFGNLYKKLEDLDAKGLARLLSLDKDITGSRGPSKMAKNAGTRAANIFYKSASAARAAGQWARAVDYARRTLQADPGHAGASNIVNDLKSKAKEIYLQAYAMKDSNPEDAIPKFKEVMAMTPADDETHIKAKNRLADLQR
jgi:tetratricopeptide (TPR) repeat protein